MGTVPARARLCVGIAHHLGWAVAVTAEGQRVLDRRRLELLEPGFPAAPAEHEIDSLDNSAAAELLARVRASAERATAASLDALSGALGAPIHSLSLRAWPLDFPADVATLRRAPYVSQADSVMYRQVLAEAAQTRGWRVHLYDSAVEDQASRLLGPRAVQVLHGPRKDLGPPWSKDHRTAFAAAILARK
jgi:hypothetical protein